MSYQLTVVLAGAVAVIVYDVLASLASQRFGFPYAGASIGSYVIYGVIGFFAARGAEVQPILSATIAAGIAGFVDATIGWRVSWAMGSGRLPRGQLTFARWVQAAVFVVAIASAVGAVGGAVGRRADAAVATSSNG